MRLTNFASVDPFHQQRGVKGLDGGKKQVQPIWDEFNVNREELIFESERILAQREHTELERKYAGSLQEIEQLKGEDKLRIVKTRVNQYVFRQMVLANYADRCAITGIDIPDLLLASHIVPWSKNEKERLNPENGICLSPLYDRAFDKGFIGINSDFEIVLSPVLKEKQTLDYHIKHFTGLHGIKITLPHKYHPKKEFLEYHMDMIFVR